MKTTKYSWKKLKWGDLATLEYGKGLRGYQNTEETYPVYGTNGQIGWHKEPLCHKHGIIIGRKGAYRGIHYSSKPFFVIDTAFYLNPITDSFDVKWAYYQLLDFDINSLDSGSAIPSTSRDAFYQIRVNLPPLSTQHKIASILSAYDELIENNTRRIKILEEMAQSLYKEWFVNFRFPGHEKVKMVDSDLGKIPEGWKLKKLMGIIDYYIGGGWGNENIDDKFSKGAYVIRGTNIPNVSLGNLTSCPYRFHTLTNFEPRKIKSMDIVFEVSGGSKGQPVGRSVLIVDELLKQFDADVICASFCKLIRPNINIISPFFLAHLLKFIYDNGEIIKYQTQSTGISNFKFEFFLDDVKVAIPNNELMQSFDNIMRLFYKQIHKLGHQNTVLRRTRDLLLPKLISGEIDV